MRTSARFTRSISIFSAAITLFVFSMHAGAQQDSTPHPKGDGAKPTAPAIYDEAADAKAQIAAAVAKAGRDNKRVLVMFGANWCGWCHKLHDLFKADSTIAKELLYEYELVTVDVGKFDKNLDVVTAYGAGAKDSGIPYLTILDGAGKVLTNQETGALEAGQSHDAAKVKALLTQWQATARSAPELLAAGIEQARREGKRVFLHFGAPWCGWCHKLEDFLARKDISELMATDYVDVKIDNDRMTNAAEVTKKYRGDAKGGIPWFAILDPSAAASSGADGKTEAKVLATSESSKGNIGYPSAPEEIAHFIGMLKSTAKRMTPEQIAKIEKALKDSAPAPARRD